jgi:hypothetical protein
MTFAKRTLSFTFQLGQGAFGNDGQFDTLTVTGLRAQVEITKVTGQAMGTANARIFGMTRSQLAQLSALNKGTMLSRNNKLSIAASTDETNQQLSTIFQGEISLGQIDMAGTPDSALVILSYASLFNATQPAKPTSYPGSADVATIMETLANQMGYHFENDLDAPITLETPYLPGTLRDQAQRVVDAANINWVIDNGILAIWNKAGSRNGSVPLISPKTGLIDYPTYAAGVGIGINMQFNPFLNMGEVVEVQSSLTFANGRWVIFNLEHSLESETPDGEWFTRFTGSPYNTTGSVIQQ